MSFMNSAGNFFFLNQHKAKLNNHIGILAEVSMFGCMLYNQITTAQTERLKGDA